MSTHNMIFFREENVVGSQQKWLIMALLMSTHSIMFSREIRKIYLILWILCLARAMKSLSQD